MKMFEGGESSSVVIVEEKHLLDAVFESWLQGWQSQTETLAAEVDSSPF